MMRIIHFHIVVAILVFVGACPLLTAQEGEPAPQAETAESKERPKQTEEQRKAAREMREKQEELRKRYQKSMGGQSKKSGNGVNLSELLAFMKPSDVVLQVGDSKMTWREFFPMYQMIRARLPKVQDSSFAAALENNLRQMLTNIAMRGLFLHEFDARGLKLSKEDRERLEEKVLENLSLSERPQSLADFKGSHDHPSTLAYPNYEDILKMLRIGEVFSEKIEVTDKHVDAYISVRKQMDAVNIRMNKDQRGIVEKYQEDPRILSDKGFAQMARELSEGEEALNGGVVPVLFTRQELADANGVERFDYKQGETTPVFETESCYRIMRVLEVLPPEGGAGAAPRSADDFRQDNHRESGRPGADTQGSPQSLGEALSGAGGAPHCQACAYPLPLLPGWPVAG